MGQSFIPLSESSLLLYSLEINNAQKSNGSTRGYMHIYIKYFVALCNTILHYTIHTPTTLYSGSIITSPRMKLINTFLFIQKTQYGFISELYVQKITQYQWNKESDILKTDLIYKESVTVLHRVRNTESTTCRGSQNPNGNQYYYSLHTFSYKTL